MKKIFLHIGTHKTGTTYIQRFMANAREELLKRDVLYPNGGRSEKNRSTGHHLLSASLREQRDPAKDSCWQEVLREIELHSQQTIVLSSEDFCRVSAGSIEKLCNLLQNYHVHIIIYLRKPVDFLVSMYKATIRTYQNTQTFQDYSRSRVESINYNKLVFKWSEFINKEDLYLRSYDMVKMKVGIEQELFNIIGIPPNGMQGFLQNNVNAAMHDELTNLFLHINRFENKFNIDRKNKYSTKLKLYLRSKPRTFWLFSMLRAKLDSPIYCQEDLDWIVNEFKKFDQDVLNDYLGKDGMKILTEGI